MTLVLLVGSVFRGFAWESFLRSFWIPDEEGHLWENSLSSLAENYAKIFSPYESEHEIYVNHNDDDQDYIIYDVCVWR